MSVRPSESTSIMPVRAPRRHRGARAASRLLGDARRATPGDYRRLIRAAERSRHRAYAPYSRFPVGAAVLTSSGSVYAGCNVENASYGLTQCAERVAIQSAVAAGQRRLVAVAVVGPPGTFPCGACRQVMEEFGVKTVILASPRRAPAVVALRDLLPRPFARPPGRASYARL